MLSKLYVCFTMDVERVKEKSPTGGPDTWDLGERSVRDYCGFLRERGYPVTLFIVPDAADRQAKLFQELQSDGHECGMHFHNQSWRGNYRDPEAHDYLGGYRPDEQYALLEEARQQLADALRFEPLCFRPGNFSANDDTFGVLASLGFASGSVSQPNRCVPRFKAVWTGAPRAVHRAHGTFRLVPGSLGFVEVPVTVDTSRSDHRFGVGDIRFEICGVAEVLQGIRDSLDRLQQDRALIAHVCFFTHNFVCYADTGGAPRSRLSVLEGVLKAMPEVAAQYDLEPEGVTISAVREHYLAAEARAKSVTGDLC